LAEGEAKKLKESVTLVREIATALKVEH